MPQLRRSDAEIFYEVQGDHGPWITLVNGHTRSGRDFRMLSRFLTSHGYRCLTFDNRGSGQTITHKPFQIRDMVDDILALWKECHIERSSLLGISMGGMISQILAAEQPQRVHALILVSTAASVQQLSSAGIGSWGTTLEEVQTRLLAYVTPDFFARNKLLVQAMAKQILQAIQEEAFEQRAQEQRRALAHLDNHQLLARIPMPVLILHGADDQIIAASAAQDLAQHIPQAELQLLPGIGHLLLAEDSRTLGERVRIFLQNHISGKL